jgi:cytochrome b
MIRDRLTRAITRGTALLWYTKALESQYNTNLCKKYHQNLINLLLVLSIIMSAIEAYFYEHSILNYLM